MSGEPRLVMKWLRSIEFDYIFAVFLMANIAFADDEVARAIYIALTFWILRVPSRRV